jgi:hypothetical protein
MMSEQTILNNAFKAIFTPESIGAAEVIPKTDEIIKKLINSGRVDNGNMTAAIEVRGMTRAELNRFADVTLALFTKLLWNHSIYANDPLFPDYITFSDKLEELTKRRLFVAVKSEKTGDMNDDTIIEEGFLGVSFGQMDHSKCNSCPTCIAEKRALIKKNVDAALKKRAEAEADLTSTCINCKKTFTFADKENYPDCCSDKCKAQDMYFDALKKQLDSSADSEKIKIVLPIESICDIPVSVWCGRTTAYTRNEGDTITIYRLQVDLDTLNQYHHDSIHDYNHPVSIRMYENDPNGSMVKTLTYEKLKADIKMLIDNEQVWLDVLCGEIRVGKEMNDSLKSRSDLRSMFLETFKGNAGLKLADRTCCVCDEPTLSITACGHSLCVGCLVGVDKEITDEEDDVPCPMCRKDIRYGWKQCK